MDRRINWHKLGDEGGHCSAQHILFHIHRFILLHLFRKYQKCKSVVPLNDQDSILYRSNSFGFRFIHNQ